MSDEALKKLNEIQEDMKEIKEYIAKNDVVKNIDFCNQRNPPIAYPTLIGWFQKGCPRVDSRHVSKKEVNEWVSKNNTRKKKP